MTLIESSIKAKIRRFIKDNFLINFGCNSLNNSDSFLKKGIIDSTGVLELVSFAEKTFNIKVEDEELIPDNLDSVDKIASFIKKKKS